MSTRPLALEPAVQIKIKMYIIVIKTNYINIIYHTRHGCLRFLCVYVALYSSLRGDDHPPKESY
jgi:hypothetical protein